MSSNADGMPWLDEPPPSAAPKVGSRSMLPWYLLLALLMAAVVAGAWWIITRKEAPPPQLPIEALPLEQPSSPSDQSTEQAQLAAPADSGAEPPRAPPFERAAEPQRMATPEPAAAPVRAQPTRRAETAGRSIRRAQERTAGDLTRADEPQPVIFRTEPNRGRVVQLGAFPTSDEADKAWRKLARRYPYLATKPKLVSPVEVRSLGGGRPMKLYRLQLGTASQAQSVVICQQLERAGQSCVVVY